MSRIALKPFADLANDGDDERTHFIFRLPTPGKSFFAELLARAPEPPVALAACSVAFAGHSSRHFGDPFADIFS